VLFFYLLEDDPLVKFIVTSTSVDFSNGVLMDSTLNRRSSNLFSITFHYSDGDEFDYATSTTHRWGEGFRGVMRNIDVIESQQALHGQIPQVGIIPLLVASGYSWETYGKDWLSQPIGWHYLFQQEQYWDSLAERVSEHQVGRRAGFTVSCGYNRLMIPSIGLSRWRVTNDEREMVHR